MEQRYYAQYRELEDSHWWFRGRRAILRRILADRLASEPGRLVLDLGCGTGAMLPELARHGAVHGADADPEAVRFCRARGFSDIELLDSQALPWEADTFGAVTAFDVLEHLDDDRGMVAEIRRVLRPGGCLFLTVPAFMLLWGPQDEISHHRRRYRASQVRALLSGERLELEKLSYFNTLLFPPIAAIRVGRRPFVKSERSTAKSDFTMSRPGRMNDLLASVFSMEASLVARRNLPFGVSILAVATKGPAGV